MGALMAAATPARKRIRAPGLACVAALAALPWASHAQRGRAPPAPTGPPAWAMQLPGYWASMITQDWRLRMVTPPKQEYVGIPLNAAAARIADAWDPARDRAAGLQCRGYGAAVIMQRPETLHIGWQDPHTLRMQIDAGMQLRLFHFDGAVPDDFRPDWQGYSSARWVPRRNGGRYTANARYLQVTTTHMLPGYLRQNGVPYSAGALLDEDYDLMPVSDQEAYLIVTSKVIDPTYLDAPLLLTAIFQKQPDGKYWDPQPCSSSW
jgi:hypothetical protein